MLDRCLNIGLVLTLLVGGGAVAGQAALKSAAPVAPKGPKSPGTIVDGRYDASPTDLSTGQQAPLLLDAGRRLQVLVNGRNPSTGTVQAVQTDASGGLAITTSAAGAGAVAAATPRMTLASDDPAVASLSVLDDWDEANRAAVNAIAGQVGIAGGTGVDGATVPRVSLATNVGLPAGANNIGDVDVLTVPAPLSTAGGGLEATALRVTVASDSSGVLALSELPAPAALADNAVNPTTTTIGANASVWDGATWDRATGDSANGADVDVTRLPGSLTGFAEDAAHITGDVGVEMLAVHSDAAQTLAGTDGDYAPLVATRLGALRTTAQMERYVDSLGASYLVVSAFTSVATAGAQEIEVLAAQGAGNSILVLRWRISTSVAGTENFETGGSDAGLGPPIYLAANGGDTSDFQAAWFETADNDSLQLQVSAAGTWSVQVWYVVR